MTQSSAPHCAHASQKGWRQPPTGQGKGHDPYFPKFLGELGGDREEERPGGGVPENLTLFGERAGERDLEEPARDGEPRGLLDLTKEETIFTKAFCCLREEDS